MRISLVGCVFALTGCYGPGYRDCAVTCASGTCPSGLTCSAGVCREPGQTGACPTSAGDGGPDTTPIGDGPNLTPWGPVSLVQLTSIPPAPGELDVSLSPDLLEMWLVRANEIFHVTRMSPTAAWGNPIAEAALNTSGIEEAAHVAPDGRSIFWASNRPGGFGLLDIWSATRSAAGSAWSTPRHEPVLSGTRDETSPSISADLLTMVYAIQISAANTDIYLSTRPSQAGSWAPGIALVQLDTPQPSVERGATLSSDGLTIYYHAVLAGGDTDLMQASRPAIGAPFGVPSPITELNSGVTDRDPWVSPDGRHIFFISDRNAGGLRIFESSR